MQKMRYIGPGSMNGEIVDWQETIVAGVDMSYVKTVTGTVIFATRNEVEPID